jgi:DNA-binding transcriptional LysR family regulator
VPGVKDAYFNKSTRTSFSSPFIHDLVAFCGVAHCGGIEAAAERYGWSKGTVSSQLNRLEDWVGVQLINRRPDGPRSPAGLTEAGQQFLTFAETAVSAILDGVEAIGGEWGRGGVYEKKWAFKRKKVSL